MDPLRPIEPKLVLGRPVSDIQEWTVLGWSARRPATTGLRTEPLANSYGFLTWVSKRPVRMNPRGGQWRGRPSRAGGDRYHRAVRRPIDRDLPSAERPLG